MLGQVDLKVALFTCKAVNLSESQDFNVDMPADLDQFR
jgi:hypothetical protein